MKFPRTLLSLSLMLAAALASAPALAHLDHVHPAHVHEYELAGWGLLAVLALAFLARHLAKGSRPGKHDGGKRLADWLTRRHG